MRGASSNVSRADFVAPNLASNTHKKGGGRGGWEGLGGFLSEPLLLLPSIIFPLQRLQPSATLGRPQMSQRKGAARDEMANQHGGFAASYPPSVGEQVRETRRGKQDALWVFLSFVINQLFLSVLTLK